MSDYTELVKALRGIDMMGSCPCDYSNICQNFECITDQAAAAIEELQAEVKRLEPKRGEWYKPYGFTQKSYKRVCTNCQDVAYFCGKGNYLYCPNCGAKMGGTDASRPD